MSTFSLSLNIQVRLGDQVFEWNAMVEDVDLFPIFVTEKLCPTAQQLATLMLQRLSVLREVEKATSGAAFRMGQAPRMLLALVSHSAEVAVYVMLKANFILRQQFGEELLLVGRTSY